MRFQETHPDQWRYRISVVETGKSLDVKQHQCHVWGCHKTEGYIKDVDSWSMDGPDVLQQVKRTTQSEYREVTKPPGTRLLQQNANIQIAKLCHYNYHEMQCQS